MIGFCVELNVQTQDVVNLSIKEDAIKNGIMRIVTGFLRPFQPTYTVRVLEGIPPNKFKKRIQFKD